MTTEQETFWRGEFGDDYSLRNDGSTTPARLNFWSKILSATGAIGSAYEIGTNIGLNLDAIKTLSKDIKTLGCEINASAYEVVSGKGHDVEHASAFDISEESAADLAFTSGVLIHIAPERLEDVYKALYMHSNRYILVNEYYSPGPVEVRYRGHDGKLFKRDFAGELMDMFDLRLVDYGFTWRRDPLFPLDDSNWFLLEKN